MSKYNIGLKTLIPESKMEPEFSGDLVYKFRKSYWIYRLSYRKFQNWFNWRIQKDYHSLPKDKL